MPYQVAEYSPPSMPEIHPHLKSFDDVREAISRLANYLQLVQAADVLYFQHLRENQKQAATTQGPDIASAATITVTKFIHVVTGNASVTTIISPRHFVGQLMLVSADGFSLATGGNISTARAVQAGTYVMLMWVSSRRLWYVETT